MPMELSTLGLVLVQRSRRLIYMAEEWIGSNYDEKGKQKMNNLSTKMRLGIN